MGLGVRGGVLLRLFGLCVLAGVLVASLLVPVAFGAGALVNQTSYGVNNLSGSLERQEMPMVTTMTDKNGKPIAYLYDQYRKPVSSEEIPNVMKSAITSVEDQRFWEHHGVDPQGTLRALITDLTAGSSAQGGSTLTQQYVKNYLVYVLAKTPAERHKAQESTVARKLREARTAVEVEKNMSKDDILTAYLNVVPFGNQTFGIAAASQVYFGTTPDKLTVAQSALLAAIVNQPGSLNPVTKPQEALQRRNVVIDLMTNPGNDYRITKADAEKAKQEPLGIVDPLQRPPNKCVGAGDSQTSGFFCAYVEDYLEKSGISTEQLLSGGYTIRTTLDPKANRIAKEASEHNVPKNSKYIGNPVALVEPGRDKHRIRAAVSNRDFGPNGDKGQTMYNQPMSTVPFGAGSVYKIFTAAAAMQKGVGIFDKVDAPAHFTSSVFKNGTKPYSVGNAEGISPGPRTLQKALATSPNTAFVKLLEKAGVGNAVDMAAKLGMRNTMLHHNLSGSTLKSDGSNGPSMAQKIKQTNNGAFTLGFTPTNVLELANTTATIASGGMWCPPTPVEQVLDRDGNPVPLKEQPCQQAVPQGLANSLAQGMSKDDQPGGTSEKAAKKNGWNRPVMAKTGTTQDYKSSAFIAATPQLAGAVLTYTDGRKTAPMCDTHPPSLCSDGNMFGGNVPARTFYEAVGKILAGKPALPLPPTDPHYK